jgi:uncharacterized protein
VLGVYPLFAGDRVTELVQFLDDHLGDGRGLGVLRSVREGKYRPHKKLLDHTAAMIKGEPSYVLLDEQQVVFKTILAKVAEAKDLGTKAVFVIRGGPGTGKSVIALNLVAELAANGYAVHHATGSAAFTNTVRKRVGTRASGMFKFFNSYLNAEDDTLDVLVCDEAHRIRKHSWDRFRKKDAIDPDRPQIDELLSVARVGVFFIDDMQAVKRDEIGNSDDIERLAESTAPRSTSSSSRRSSAAAARTGSSGGSSRRWASAGRRTLWTGDDNFDFDIVDSPRSSTRSSVSGPRRGTARGSSPATAGPGPSRATTARSLPTSGRRLEPAVERASERDRAREGIPKSYFWASEPGGIDQVGCIYTAQGFEFDYAGVVFGNDLVYRPREGWVGRKEFSYDGGLKRGTSDEDFTRLVKNTYRVLLSRGLKGCYVYFTDEKTRDFFESRIDRLALELAAERDAGYGGEAFVSVDPIDELQARHPRVRSRAGLGAVPHAEEPRHGPGGEVGELVEIFQWLTADEAGRVMEGPRRGRGGRARRRLHLPPADGRRPRRRPGGGHPSQARTQRGPLPRSTRPWARRSCPADVKAQLVGHSTGRPLLDALRWTLDDAEEAILCSAFVRRAGVHLIEPQLRALGQEARLVATSVFGGASTQLAMAALATAGTRLRVANPGRGTFHPKIYVARKATRSAR